MRKTAPEANRCAHRQTAARQQVRPASTAGSQLGGPARKQPPNSGAQPALRHAEYPVRRGIEIPCRPCHSHTERRVSAQLSSELHAVGCALQLQAIIQPRWVGRMFMHRRPGSSRPHMPRIVRQVRHDVVVSAAGCRIDEHLGRRPAEASSGPVTPNRPEVGQEARRPRHHTE